MEGENRNDPVIDAGTGGDIWVRAHAFNIPGIDFNNKILNTNKIESKGSESVIKAVKFELQLWEARLTGVEGDGTELGKIPFAKIFGVTLGSEKSYSNVRSVNGKNDRGMRSIVNGTDGRWIYEGKFEVFLHCDLTGAEVEQLVFASEFDDSCVSWTNPFVRVVQTGLRARIGKRAGFRKDKWDLASTCKKLCPFDCPVSP